MSVEQILAELPKLKAEERRRIAREIFDMEDEANLLAGCDARADQNFLILDRMEAEDAAAKPR